MWFAQQKDKNSTYRTHTDALGRLELQPNHHHVRGGNNFAAEEPVVVDNVTMSGQDVEMRRVEVAPSPKSCDAPLVRSQTITELARASAVLILRVAGTHGRRVTWRANY